jgi:lysophospholipase L1-like esterase
MMEDLRKQAERFGADLRFGVATAADLSKSPYKITIDEEKVIEAQTVIIATGAAAKYLGLEDEKKYAGMGVSACATCDGFFYRKKVVAVVGGGDTACEEASYLAGLASKVYLIVRKPFLRASKIMQKRVMENEKIGVLFEHNAVGLYGDNGVEGGLSEPAMKRFDRDILGQTGVDKLIIFEGTNDIGCCGGNYEHVTDTLIACYKVLIAKAKAKGIKVYGGTITPTKGNGWYSYWHEAMRQTVNEWIRKSGAFDEVIDFDELTRDPKDPQRLKAEYSDDWLHLNPKGYEAMGKFAAEKLK